MRIEENLVLNCLPPSYLPSAWVPPNVYTLDVQVSHGVRVLADMQEAGIKPRENHYTFLLREAVGRGAFEEAFVQVLDMVEGGVTPRLRSYAPLLAGLCSKVRMPASSRFILATLDQIRAFLYSRSLRTRLRFLVYCLVLTSSIP